MIRQITKNKIPIENKNNMSKPEIPANDLDIVEDYLEEDKPIPGQKYVCLSFISPEKVLEDKKTFHFYNFMKKQNPEYAKSLTEFTEDFRFYCEENEEPLQEQFDEVVNYQTNVRGIKVRGVYDNIRAANIRAKVLQKLDRSFHVYVGQVGFWLPWDPSANNMADQEYAEPELNRLVKEYRENETKKDMFYEEQKREKQQAAMEESIRLKKLQKEQKEQEALEAKQQAETNVDADSTSTDTAATDAADSTTADSTATATAVAADSTADSNTETTAEGEGVVNTVSIDTPSSESAGVGADNSVDEQLKESLDSVDPWMARKMEGDNN